MFIKKYSIVAFFLISVISCSNPSQDSKLLNKKDENAKESSDFKVLKSGIFWNELDEGKFQIISLDEFNIDTIDSDFGVNKLKDGTVIYLKVTKGDDFKSKEDSIYGFTSEYYLLKNSQKKLINTLDPYFHDFYSSPTLIKNDLYYWGINLTDSLNYTFDILAIKLNLETNQITSEFLFKDAIGTDDRGYFTRPYMKNNKIIFESNENQKWTFNKDFELEK